MSWGVSELAHGAALPFGRVLDQMAELGYVGTELGPWGYLPTAGRALRRELASRALVLAGAFCPVTLHDPERQASQVAAALATARLLADVGAPTLVLAEAGDERRRRWSGRVGADAPRFSADDWARFADGANEIARQAQAFGLETAFHSHAGTYVETPEEIEALLERTDPALVGLCLDTGHIAYGGGDPLALALRHAPRVRHVHLKDLRADVHRSALTRGLDFAAAVAEDVFAPLGGGSLPLGGVLLALREAGYGGWLIVEQDIRMREGRDPKRDAARSYAFLRETLA